MLGASLSRQTLSNWIIGAAREFESVYDLMKEKLLGSHYVQADETTVVLVDSKGEESKAKKYMWLYKIGNPKDPVILYDYQKTRSSSCPKEFLKGFSGIFQTDGYAGYNQIENIKLLYCLAHIRRKYFDTELKNALPRSPLGEALEYSKKLLPSFRIFITNGSLEIDTILAKGP